METKQQKVCPKCGCNDVYEAVYGVSVFRRVDIINDDDWDILDEEIGEDEPTLSRYECYRCDHIYKSTNIIDVIEEMIYEEEYKEKRMYGPEKEKS